MLCQGMNLPVTEAVRFINIPVSSPDNLRIGDEVLDWWPEEEFDNRRKALTNFGWHGAQWRMLAGTLHTVSLLFECREDAEALAAVLIAASMWDKVQNPPEAWHGRITRLVDKMSLCIWGKGGIFERKGIAAWHHASREALPLNIVRGEFARSLQPSGFRDLVRIAIIESTLSLSRWKLVRVYHERTALVLPVSG